MAHRHAPPGYSRPIPTVNILLIGSPGVGKATFLTRLPQIRPPKHISPTTGITSSTKQTLPPLPHPLPVPPTPLSYDITLFGRPYHFNLYCSTSTLFIDPFPADINFTIIGFAVNDRNTLHNAQFYWRKQLSLHYGEQENDMPVMLVGLKRDMRTDRRRRKETLPDGIGPGAASSGNEKWNGSRAPPSYNEATGTSEELDGEWEYECVMPEEGFRAAQEMRCDRYAECSALTGELMWEVLEDITKTAARTTTEKGGMSDGGCTLM